MEQSSSGGHEYEHDEPFAIPSMFAPRILSLQARNFRACSHVIRDLSRSVAMKS